MAQASHESRSLFPMKTLPTAPGDHHDMLQMRPNCECCDRDLPAISSDAWICSFECTFCTACAHDLLHGICPNCSGRLQPRPPRGEVLLAKYPASQERVFKPGGC